MLVCGEKIDSGVIPGFRYLVRPLNEHNYLFAEQAFTLKKPGLQLKSIRHSRAQSAYRFDFEGEDNYFYSDNYDDGYALEYATLSVFNSFIVMRGLEPVALAWVKSLLWQEPSEFLTKASSIALKKEYMLRENKVIAIFKIKFKEKPLLLYEESTYAVLKANCITTSKYGDVLALTDIRCQFNANLNDYFNETVFFSNEDGFGNF